MSETLRLLLSDPATYGILVVVLGLGRLYVRKRISSGVDHQFALRLEDHRQSLRLAAESTRFEFEESLSRTRLYIENAHAAAVEVYQAVRQAHGYCLNLRSLKRSLTFEEFNEEDLREYMSERDVPNGKQQQILHQLSNDRESAIRDLRGYLRMLDVQEAERKLADAKNVTYLNELYFDDGAIAVLDRFFGTMDKWMFHINYPMETKEDNERPSDQTMRDVLEEVHEALRARLAGTSDRAVLDKEQLG